MPGYHPGIGILDKQDSRNNPRAIDPLPWFDLLPFRHRRCPSLEPRHLVRSPKLLGDLRPHGLFRQYFWNPGIE
jgi:hypothetical protein